MGMQVARWLRSWASRAPDRPSVVLDGETPSSVTFAELDAQACRVAGALTARGLGVGDRIALLAANDLDFVAVYYGALYAGLVVLPLPTASSLLELRFRLEHASIRLLVCDDAHRSLALGAAESTATHVVDGRELLIQGSKADGPIDLPTDATAMLLYTSGTTGGAKAACITHASLTAHTSACVHHVLRLGPEDVVMGALPLTHSYGLRMALLAPLFAGARTVLVRRFDAARVATLLRTTGVTWFPGVPTMFSALGRLANVERPGRLRWALSAGAPLPAAVRERAEDVLGAEVREGFGLTEATFTTLDTPEDEGGVGTVGRAVPGVEIAIVDERGRRLPSLESGEIVVRGQNLMSHYLDDAEATNQALREGWLHTGDLGFLDAAGRLRVVDRKKDLILRGGFNVVPAEVEAALASYPQIAEALVVGVPDEHYGEEVAAVVVLRTGASLDPDDLVAHLRARLSGFKRPRLFATIPALPIGASGKALRRSVRASIASGDVVLSPLVTT